MTIGGDPVAVRGIRGLGPRGAGTHVVETDNVGKFHYVQKSQYATKTDVAQGGVVPPAATTSTPGVVQPDGTTILISGAVISALAQRHIYAPCVVASLPVGVQGDHGFVTDATTTLALGLGLAPTGGGGNETPVYRDSVGWKIG